jgi:Zn-dependent metalloprotease
MKALFTFLVFVGGIGFLWVGLLSEPASQERETAEEAALSELAPRQASIAIPGRRALAAAQTMIETLASGQTPEKIAAQYLEENRVNWGVQEHHEIRADLSAPGNDGPIRFSVYQAGIPVWGMKFEVKMGANGEVEDVQVNYRPISEADLSQPRLKHEELAEALEAEYEIDKTGPPATTVVYSGGSDSEAVPALMMTLKNKNSNTSHQALVRVSDGQVLNLTAATDTL